MAFTWKRSGEGRMGAHALARDATLRLRAARSELVVRVTAGSVLVTREGDLDDHALGPGDELRLTGRGLAVAWALSPAQVVVSGGERLEAPGFGLQASGASRALDCGLKSGA
jgi:hypothetical protein